MLSGLMVACSVAAADQPQTSQPSELAGLPGIEESDTQDFAAWTDEIFGSGVASPPVATSPAARESGAAAVSAPVYSTPPRIAQRDAEAQRPAAVVVPSELNPAMTLSPDAAQAPSTLEPIHVGHLNPAASSARDSARIALQNPARDGRPADPSAKRISLMDGDMSY
ncbi:MAG: hypothetical protein ACF788_03415, partial [Novipirellula sp. JB048]